jgi:hypothetical protein
MPPRQFWWLYETLEGQKTKRSSLSAQDKRAIKDMLNGNDNGGFW